MKQALVLTIATIMLSLAGYAQDGKGKAVGAKVQTTAVVTAIDLSARQVTLKTADGKEVTANVPETVKNLKQVAVGDTLKITYAAAVAVRLNPATAAPAEPTTVVGTAKEGEKPAGVAAQTTTINAKVEAIDLKANTVTFKGPKGNTRTVAVKDPKYQEMLKKLKVGDVVEITYAEALAIAVEGAKK